MVVGTTYSRVRSLIPNDRKKEVLNFRSCPGTAAAFRRRSVAFPSAHESDFSRRQLQQPIVGEFVRIMGFPESSLPLIVIYTIGPEVALQIARCIRSKRPVRRAEPGRVSLKKTAKLSPQTISSSRNV